MDDERLELVRIDATGTAHPVGKTASRELRARQGSFRLMPSPPHLVVMRYVGEDGKRDAADGPIFRLSGEITAPGAICDIVALIGQAGWSGELVVLEKGASRSLFFERSQLISAKSTVEAERLGEILYRYGAVTRAQVDKTLAAATGEVRFGEVAVRLGFVSRERLFQLMGKQVEEIAFAVLRVSDGMFYFLETYDESRLASRHNFPVHALLMEGVRRMDETRYFRDRIPSDQHVPERVPGREPPPEELLKIYEAVDGTRSVAEIGRVVGQGEFEVTQALFQLVQSGLLVIHTPRATGPAAIVALFNEAIALIFQEIDATGHGGEVREQLSSFATGAGIYDTLFQKAGPAPDGTLIAERILENIVVLVGPSDAEAMLSQWLYEYVSFAIFIAEPFLRPPADSSATGSTKTPLSVQGSLAKRVAVLVAPLAPKM
ncbi:MAG: DUF4388 domain-containing protein [Byssovorax sp.]